MQLSIDFETRSTTDLPRQGVYRYVQDPNTEIWCMAYAWPGEEEPQLWVPGMPVPDELYAAESFRAWNAQFERIVWKTIGVERYGFPEVKLDQWYCTQAEAAAMALPLGLGKCASVLRVEDKDDAGNRLMKQMAKPRKPRKNEDPDALLWWDDEGRRARLYDYCKQDVRVEQQVAEKLRRLPKRERRAYLLDQQINDRGVEVDMDLVRSMQVLANEAMGRASVRLDELTEGAVTSVTDTAGLRKYLGVDSVAADRVAELLREETDPVRREILQLRADNGKSSVGKLDAIMRCEVNGRLHGLLQYHGASTGRWAGRLVQPQNFPRPTVKDPERFIPLVLDGRYDEIEEEAPVMEVLASLLRSTLVGRFVCADFSSIEGWVVAYLAGQDGMTSYFEMAGRIFGKDPETIEKGTDEYSVGKVAVLGCGFGMGWKRYRDTVYEWTGLEIADELAQLAVNTYRSLNFQIKDLWYELEDAAIAAVRNPGAKIRCGRGGCLTYKVKGPYLWCELPSGRLLCYPLPKLVDALAPWGEAKEAVEISTTNSYTRKWERRTLYGGLQTENVVQAVARDLMLDAMFRLEGEGHRTVLTVHDEILAEAPGADLDAFAQLMGQPSEWAPELVVKAEGWQGPRYRKD